MQSLHHDLIILFLFSFLFSLSTLFLCIVSASFSYRAFSSFAARLSLSAVILLCKYISNSPLILGSERKLCALESVCHLLDARLPSLPSSPSPLPSQRSWPLSPHFASHTYRCQLSGGMRSSKCAIAFLVGCQCELQWQYLFRTYRFCAFHRQVSQLAGLQHLRRR